MKKTMLVIGLLIGLSAILAINLQFNVDSSAWQMSRGAKSYPLIMSDGNPALPFYPIQVLIPFGEVVESVEVELQSTRTVATGITLDYVRSQQPVSKPSADLTIPNALVWNGDRLYPEGTHTYLGTQSFRGYSIAIINVYPWKYNPVSKQIFSAGQIAVTINTRSDYNRAYEQAAFVTRNSSTYNDLQNTVSNIGAYTSYSAAASFRKPKTQNRLIDLSIPKRMIIITDQTRAPWFSEYVLWRTSQGVSTAVYLTSDIYAEYGGVDNAEKVRNFIIDAYQTWAGSSTPLEYVILGGDDEVVPERGARGVVGQTVDNRMPTDLYFSCLDGTWNANGNNIWGEVNDNVDLIPEVHIGRFSAEAQSEFSNIFRKTRHYVETNDFSSNVSLMIGENLNWNPLTWGGDYKDDVALHVPNTYHIQTLYQRDGTYSGTAVWNAINTGANVMNHMGHANENSLMGQAINTVNSLQNDRYGFLYSQGCYPAAFDQRTSGDNECIGEHLVMANSALFAFIGNTRYGWYMPGSINGASQYYDREFFIGMFEMAYTELGKALTYSRLQNLNAALASDVMRWCYYEVVLFGDPSISVKYPDAAMPFLSIHDYSVNDVEGDNDGTINPGEIIRVYPRIRNHQDWHTASNVSMRIEGLPTGSTMLSDQVIINQLAPGETSSSDIFFRIQLGNELGFGTYNVTLVVDALHPQTGESIGARRFPLQFSISLMDNRFPWESDFATKSAPVVYDFNGDGNLDILYLDVFGSASFIGSNGEDYQNISTTEQLNINSSFAMADLDGDGELDLAISSRTGDLIGLKQDGTQIFSAHENTQFFLSPVIGDVNGDGTPDIAVSGVNRKLYVFNTDGTVQSGFPLTMTSSIPAELAMADLDGDGAMEIIFGTGDGLLYAVKSGGELMLGWPVQLSGSVSGAPAILNNNRIACGTNEYIYLLETDGTIVFQRAIGANLAGGIVLADMTRDANLEIIGVTSMGTLYVLNQSGNDLPGFPVSAGEYFTCPPLVADLDGDGFCDILLHSYINAVHIYKRNGNIMPGFPFPIAFNGATPATLVDFDNDGFYKLVSGFSTGVLMVNLRKPANSLAPWTQYRGSLSRQGSFTATGFVSNPNDNLPMPATLLMQNYPNPFNPTTTISFSLNQSAHTSLEIFNLKGQKVRVLLSQNLNSGKHSLVWDGKDDMGKALGSGIYFYRLNSGSHQSTRKMLMLK